MATKYLVAQTDNDIMLAANYGGGVAPVTGDTIVVAVPGLVLTTNVSHALNGIEFCDIVWEASAKGTQIGTKTSPFEMGNDGGFSNILFNGPRAKGLHFDGACTLVQVLATLPEPDNVTLQGAVAIAEVLVTGGIGLHMLNGPTYTLLRLDGADAWVTVENGVAIPTLRALRGRASIATQVVNSYIDSAQIEYIGNTKTYSLIELRAPAGIAMLNCYKSTISVLTVEQGFADGRLGGRTDAAGDVTISAGTLRRSGRMWFGKHIVDGANIDDWGGDYIGHGTPVRKQPASAPGGPA